MFWVIFVILETVDLGFVIISLIFIDKFYYLLWVKSGSGFEELFEEFPKSSHLRDELLMLLGFLPFEGVPVEKYCVHCADVLNVFLIYCPPRCTSTAEIFRKLFPH